ncbi:MAG TPA: DUF1828 domain-containing protein [Acetobacteraceae bacterium]|nr:DUF1828 domain-containing protein [Acetobacteraceae bacterium]
MKDLLCKAFCDELSVRDVPAGLAIRTALSLSSGEPLGFYVVGPDSTGRYRIEDDGATIPLIEAAGIDLDTQTRNDAIAVLYEEYGALYNEGTGELSTPPLTMDQVPHRALQFVALLLRLQDLILLTPERVASTFREDAKKAIRSTIGDRATIQEDRSPASGIEFPADLLIEAPNRAPVAVFLAMSEQRVLEAVVAQMALMYEAKLDCSIIALLERDSSVTRRMRQRASNRLAAMPIFEGDERAAVQRIEQEVFGRSATLH